MVFSPGEEEKVTGSGLRLEPDFKLVETGEGRTTFTPKIKTLTERHAFWIKFHQTEEQVMPPAP